MGAIQYFLFQRRLVPTHSPECFLPLFTFWGWAQNVSFQMQGRQHWWTHKCGFWHLTRHWISQCGWLWWGRGRRAQSPEFDAIQPAFWALYAGEWVLSKSNRKVWKSADAHSAVAPKGGPQRDFRLKLPHLLWCWRDSWAQSVSVWVFSSCKFYKWNLLCEVMIILLKKIARHIGIIIGGF